MARSGRSFITMGRWLPAKTVTNALTSGKLGAYTDSMSNMKLTVSATPRWQIFAVLSLALCVNYFGLAGLAHVHARHQIDLRNPWMNIGSPQGKTGWPNDAAVSVILRSPPLASATIELVHVKLLAFVDAENGLRLALGSEQIKRLRIDSMPRGCANDVAVYLSDSDSVAIIEAVGKASVRFCLPFLADLRSEPAPDFCIIRR